MMNIKHNTCKRMRYHLIGILAFFFLVMACSSVQSQSPKSTALHAATLSVPKFDHIAIITFENKEFKKVVGNPYMPTINMYARNYTLLTQFYAVTHPSLPNYLAMISGSTFNINADCETCFVNAPSLPDLIEASGKTWKTYQEDMENPCGLGTQDENEYVQKHNPFVYFNPIRLDKSRCKRSVVSLNTLQGDIKARTLPNFSFIIPNMCNNGHDCPEIVTDAWLMNLLNQLIPAFEKESPDYLIVLNWDEGGEQDVSCCGAPNAAGGRIAVVLISPLVKNHFQDSTQYTHYSLLKTISKSWDLPYLGHAGEDSTALILAPWK